MVSRGNKDSRPINQQGLLSIQSIHEEPESEKHNLEPSLTRAVGARGVPSELRIHRAKFSLQQDKLGVAEDVCSLSTQKFEVTHTYIGSLRPT